jgi:molybdopterin-guanine dinucleotide biosynthesis protein A
MNRDKAWLEIDGVPMIERALKAAGPVAGRLGMIVNAGNPRVEEYEKLAESYGAKLIFDLHEHLGPLGGIHTALAHCEDGEAALILACDMPFITAEFLSFLCDIHQAKKPPLRNLASIHDPQLITVPLDQSNRLQPLAAIYDSSEGAGGALVATIDRMIASNELKVDLLYSRASTRQVGFAEFAHLRGAERFFVNVNTPEEYREALLRDK